MDFSLNEDQQAIAEAVGRIIARFGDNFRFVIFSQTTGGYKARWIVQGPMDPDEGPLTYERIKTDEERAAAAEGDATDGS